MRTMALTTSMNLTVCKHGYGAQEVTGNFFTSVANKAPVAANVAVLTGHSPPQVSLGHTLS